MGPNATARGMEGRGNFPSPKNGERRARKKQWGRNRGSKRRGGQTGQLNEASLVVSSFSSPWRLTRLRATVRVNCFGHLTLRHKEWPRVKITSSFWGAGDGDPTYLGVDNCGFRVFGVENKAAFLGRSDSGRGPRPAETPLRPSDKCDPIHVSRSRCGHWKQPRPLHWQKPSLTQLLCGILTLCSMHYVVSSIVVIPLPIVVLMMAQNRNQVEQMLYSVFKSFEDNAA